MLKLKEKSLKTNTIQNYHLKPKSITYKLKKNSSQQNLKNFFTISSNPKKLLRKKIESTQSSESSSRHYNKMRLLSNGDKVKNNSDKMIQKNSFKKRNSYFIGKMDKSNINLNKESIKQNRNIKYYNFLKKSSNCNDLTNFSEKYSKIFKEFNLNNGFSVSYFKKINPINDFNNCEIRKKSRFQSCSNKFKITFDSGDFNIPLVSSSLGFKETKIK